MDQTRRWVVIGSPAWLAACGQAASALEKSEPDATRHLRELLDESVRTGREVRVPAGRYLLQEPITVGPVRLQCEGAVELVYTGAAQVHHVLATRTTGPEVSVLGTLTISGSNRANIGFYVDNQSAQPSVLTIGQLSAQYCRMERGYAFNDGAGGIICRGNFRRLQAERLIAADITRAARSGVPGTNGTTGVEVSLTNGHAVREIEIGSVGARNITTEDRPGSPACFDVDGIYLFQADTPGSRLNVGSVEVVNAQGRAMKVSAFRDVSFGPVKIHRSIAGITDGSTEVALQAGFGSLMDVEITYSGNADVVHGQGTTCIATYTSRDRRLFGQTQFSDIRVVDRTTGGSSIRSILHTGFAGQGRGPSNVSIRGVKLVGRAVQALIDVGENGDPRRGSYDIDLTGFEGGVTTALVLTHGNGEQLSISVADVKVTGGSVPVFSGHGSGPRALGRVRYGVGNQGLQD